MAVLYHIKISLITVPSGKSMYCVCGGFGHLYRSIRKQDRCSQLHRNTTDGGEKMLNSRNQQLHEFYGYSFLENSH